MLGGADAVIDDAQKRVRGCCSEYVTKYTVDGTPVQHTDSFDTERERQRERHTERQRDTTLTVIDSTATHLRRT